MLQGLPIQLSSSRIFDKQVTSILKSFNRTVYTQKIFTLLRLLKFSAGKNPVSVGTDNKESIQRWSPTPLYAGHRHTNLSSTDSLITTGKERGNMDPRNENIEKILTMRKLAMRRLAKRQKAGVLSRIGVRPSASPFKKASMFNRVQATSATGKKYFQNFQNCFLKGAVTAVQFILLNFANYSPSIAMELKVSKQITCK